MDNQSQNLNETISPKKRFIQLSPKMLMQCQTGYTSAFTTKVHYCKMLLD